MFFSVIAFGIVLFGTLFSRANLREGQAERQFTFALSRLDDVAPAILDRLGLWTLLAVAVVIIAYAGPLYQHFSEHVYLVPGMRTW